MAEKQRVALFVDYENVVYGPKEPGALPADPTQLVSIAGEYGVLVIAKAFGDEGVIDEYADRLRSASIEAQYCKSKGEHKKNTTDFYMLDSIYQTAHTLDDIHTFVLVTGDSDFESVIAYLRHRLGKKVVVVGYPDSLSHSLKETASEWRHIEPSTRTFSSQQVTDLIRFVHSGLTEGKTITLTSTARYFKLPGWTEDEIRRQIIGLIKEGVFVQQVVEKGGNEVRTMVLNLSHPAVQGSLGPISLDA